MEQGPRYPIQAAGGLEGGVPEGGGVGSQDERDAECGKVYYGVGQFDQGGGEVEESWSVVKWL